MKNLYELKTMDRNKCIVQISGLPPFLSNKYTPSMHPNFKYIMDADDRNEFDFKKYKEKLKKTTTWHTVNSARTTYSL